MTMTDDAAVEGDAGRAYDPGHEAGDEEIRLKHQAHTRGAAVSHHATSDIQGLTNRLRAMTHEDIHNAADACRPCASAADDIAWWSATARVERLLRDQRRRRAAAVAAHNAARAVQHSAQNAGVTLDDPEVVRVARAAGDVACAITAGPAARADAAYFLARLGPELVDHPTLAA